MTPSSRSASPPDSPELLDLLAIFGDQEQAPRFTPVAPGEIPQPFRGLLAHDGHMTVTVESYFGATAILRVHATRCDAHRYSRKITLHSHPDGPPILAGIMRIHLEHCAAPVRDDILAQRLPLGRILIDHNVMRTLRSGPYFRVRADAAPLLGLSAAASPVVFARIAAMHTPVARTVELLEIIMSVERAST